MPSLASEPITARIPNDAAAELRRVAAATDRTVSSLIAEAVAVRLPELRSAA